MPNFRRSWTPGGTFFFTVVTAGRAPLFDDPAARDCLGHSLRQERASRPFVLDAIVLLPDHLHAIWTLPPGDGDYATRWSSIKSRFTRDWLNGAGAEQPVAEGQRREGRRGVWQARYMEHAIRDEDDMIGHADYIHYNPVKHGLVACPRDWPWSSFRKFVAAGDYPMGWGCAGSGTTPRFDGIDADLIE